MGISNHTTEEAGWGQGMATQVLSSCSVILGATLQAPRARLGNEHMDVMSKVITHFGMLHVDNRNSSGSIMG